jgi:hypothetical protein
MSRLRAKRNAVKESGKPVAKIDREIAAREDSVHIWAGNVGEIKVVLITIVSPSITGLV